jgi:hypothetical protein
MLRKQDLRLKKAKKHSFKNEREILRSYRAGCYHCRKLFPARKIKKWVTELDGTRTAKCPHCEIDSVIGNASGVPLNPTFLHALYLDAFCTCYDVRTGRWYRDDLH